jgi:hypothetical protein
MCEQRALESGLPLWQVVRLLKAVKAVQSGPYCFADELRAAH